MASISDDEAPPALPPTSHRAKQNTSWLSRRSSWLWIMTMKRWSPTYRQFADILTKMMVPVLWVEFMKSGRISLKETAEEAKEEERRRGLRKAQRQRPKDHMKGLETTSLAASGRSILAASSRSQLPRCNF